MKTIYFFLSIVSLSAFSDVSLDHCHEDAAWVGHHKSAVHPLPECVEIVGSHPASIRTESSDKRWKAFGQGRMVYIESYDGKGKLLGRELLAGTNHELESVSGLHIDPVHKRLFITQKKNKKSELLIFDLNFIGNVAPLKVLRSEAFANLSSVRFRNPELIEFTTADGTFTVNADAESRAELSTKKALQISRK